jgi:hypothetical protein
MAIRETVEREVKLRAAGEFKLPELGGEAIEPRLFTSTYHDAADHRLARRGVTLRHRVENGKGLWQLKLPQGRARLDFARRGVACRAHQGQACPLRGRALGERWLCQGGEGPSGRPRRAPQDAVVAAERLRDLAKRMPDTALAAGRLVEREQTRARRGRDEWRSAWKRLAKTA